jgi:hypothetical protein
MAFDNRHPLFADDDSATVYIDRPTIPEGMSIATYRELRARDRKSRGLRRIWGGT